MTPKICVRGYFCTKPSQKREEVWHKIEKKTNFPMPTCPHANSPPRPPPTLAPFLCQGCWTPLPPCPHPYAYSPSCAVQAPQARILHYLRQRQAPIIQQSRRNYGERPAGGPAKGLTEHPPILRPHPVTFSYGCASILPLPHLALQPSRRRLQPSAVGWRPTAISCSSSSSSVGALVDPLITR